MLVVDLDDQFGAKLIHSHVSIFAFGRCWNSLFYTSGAKSGRWNRPNTLILSHAMCKFEVLEQGRVGGGFGWSVWNRIWVNHTFPDLRLVVFWDWWFWICDGINGPQIGTNLLIVCYTNCKFHWCNDVMLVLDLGGQVGANIGWITRFQLFVWSLFKFMSLHWWWPMWTANWTKLLIFCSSVCRFEML